VRQRRPYSKAHGSISTLSGSAPVLRRQSRRPIFGTMNHKATPSGREDAGRHCRHAQGKPHVETATAIYSPCGHYDAPDRSPEASVQP